MNTRTFAVAGSIAALSFAAAPVAAIAAAGQPASPRAVHVERARDPRGARHVDRSRDRPASLDRRSFDAARGR